MKTHMFSPRYIIPNALTLANVACGFVSLIWAAEGDLLWAATFIGLGAIVDFLDGFSARLLKAATEFGKQLDSLSDMVTFGLAPAFLFYQFNYYMGSGWYNILSVLIVLGAAARLARFNIGTEGQDGFTGLPTPAFAILTASIPFIYESDHLKLGQWMTEPWFQVLFPIAGCALMISRMRLFSLKFKTFRFEDNLIRYAFLTLCIALLALFQFTGIPFIILTYLILSLIYNFAK